MTHYRIHSLDAEGAVTLSRRVICKDDLAALAEGVRRSDHHAIEIFDGGRLVARIKLGNAPLESSDPHSL
jgi:hypothetical protein